MISQESEMRPMPEADKNTANDTDKDKANNNWHIPLLTGAAAGTTVGGVAGAGIALNTLPKPKPRKDLPPIDTEQLHQDALSKALQELKAKGEPFTKDDITQALYAHVDAAYENIRKGDNAIKAENVRIGQENRDAINNHTYPTIGTSVGVGALVGLGATALWNRRVKKKADKPDTEIER